MAKMVSSGESDMLKKWAKCANAEFLFCWLEQAAQLPGKGPLVTALMILAQSRDLDRRQYILLTPRTLQEYGMNRVTAYRSLISLEQAGLIHPSRPTRFLGLIAAAGGRSLRGLGADRATCSQMVAWIDA